MSFNISELLQSQLGSGAVKAIADKMGINPDMASGAMSNIIPALMSGLAANASTENGAASLWSALDRDHDGSVLDDALGFIGMGGNPQDGSKIVNHILGDKQEAVAQGIGQNTGLNAGQIMGMMAQLAPIVMGFLGKQKNEQGLDASGLMSMLGGQASNLQSSPFGAILGMLDQNKDGNVMDDAMNMLGGFFGKK